VKHDTAQRLLALVMNWSDEKARIEFDFLDLMAGLKYDDYGEFLAGMRFLESLVAWLQQFDTAAERETAYNFVRQRLVFISPAERQRLVALLYPRVVYPRLLRAAASDAGIHHWEVLAQSSGKLAFERQRRSTLFLGLSDGARLDTFRHINEGAISNEQVGVGVQLAQDKWDDLLKDLRKDLKTMDPNASPAATFERVVLVDDFAASGTSFIRNTGTEWKGKLCRFYDAVSNATNPLFNADYELIIHHHIGTPKASQHLEKEVSAFLPQRFPEGGGPGRFTITFGHRYDQNIVVADADEPSFIALTKKYFDHALVTPHTATGGSPDLWLGYAECRLPIILDHNTPNNSFAILWAQTKGAKGRPMRPLFHRRQRHS
jgi:hypothetical protein